MSRRQKKKKKGQTFPSKNSFLSLGNGKQLARKETYLCRTVGSIASSSDGENFMLFMNNVWMYMNYIMLHVHKEIRPYSCLGGCTSL